MADDWSGWPASWRARMQRPRSGQWVTYGGQVEPATAVQPPVRLVTTVPALERQPDPIADLVNDLVRRFDPGGYQLQCPVSGCGWHLRVPRMELDPLEPLGDDYVTHVEGVPREDVELVLSAHVHWHAALTETDVRSAPDRQPPPWEQQEWCDGGTCEHPACLDEL